MKALGAAKGFRIAGDTLAITAGTETLARFKRTG
jgi:hypothetical protein